MVINKCYCGNEIKTYPSRIKEGRGKYCSRGCSDPHTLLDGVKGTNTRYKKNDPRIKRGKDHYKWKGGAYLTTYNLRKSPYYKRWRRAVLKVKELTCVTCGNTDNLEVDHKKQFSLYPKLRFNMANAQILCSKCHFIKSEQERRLISNPSI